MKMAVGRGIFHLLGTIRGKEKAIFPSPGDFYQIVSAVHT